MHIDILGVPIDLGADRRGVDMGPSAIRYAGLRPGLETIGHVVTDLGDTPIMLADGAESGGESAKYLAPILAMAAEVAASVRSVMERGHVPLVLGGDHSASLGSVTGVARARPIGLIWLDAHGDFNVPNTSPSGNVHGMILSALAGCGSSRMVEFGGRPPTVDPAHITLVGVRDLDPGERELLRTAGVRVFTMYEIDRLGMPDVMSRAIDIAGADVEGIHVSLDLDVIDPLQAPGVGTPVMGGLGYREAHLAMEMVAESGRLVSMDAVEVNPILDNHNQTGKLAVDLILSALGKRIF